MFSVWNLLGNKPIYVVVCNSWHDGLLPWLNLFLQASVYYWYYEWSWGSSKDAHFIFKQTYAEALPRTNWSEFHSFGPKGWMFFFSFQLHCTLVIYVSTTVNTPNNFCAWSFERKKYVPSNNCTARIWKSSCLTGHPFSSLMTPFLNLAPAQGLAKDEYATAKHH